MRRGFELIGLAKKGCPDSCPDWESCWCRCAACRHNSHWSDGRTASCGPAAGCHMHCREPRG